MGLLLCLLAQPPIHRNVGGASVPEAMSWSHSVDISCSESKALGGASGAHRVIFDSLDPSYPLGSWPWRLISGSESQAPSNLPRFTVMTTPEVGYRTRSLPDYQLHPNLWHVVGASNSKLVHSWPRPWPKPTWKTLSMRREAHDKHVKNLEVKGCLAWPKRPSTSGLANLCERIFKLSKQVCDARTSIETCLTSVGTASVYHLLKDGNNSGASEIDPHAVLWTP